MDTIKTSNGAALIWTPSHILIAKHFRSGIPLVPGKRERSSAWHRCASSESGRPSLAVRWNRRGWRILRSRSLEIALCAQWDSWQQLLPVTVFVPDVICVMHSVYAASLTYCCSYFCALYSVMSNANIVSTNLPKVYRVRSALTPDCFWANFATGQICPGDFRVCKPSCLKFWFELCAIHHLLLPTMFR